LTDIISTKYLHHFTIFDQYHGYRTITMVYDDLTNKPVWNQYQIKCNFGLLFVNINDFFTVTESCYNDC